LKLLAGFIIEDHRHQPGSVFEDRILFDHTRWADGSNVLRYLLLPVIRSGIMRSMELFVFAAIFLIAAFTGLYIAHVNRGYKEQDRLERVRLEHERNQLPPDSPTA